MGKNKNTKKSSVRTSKRTSISSYSSDDMQAVWRFDMLDRSGDFAFDINRADFNANLFLDKMISYSNMTWREIKQQTHDKQNKSKNHHIDAGDLSDAAQDRLKALRYEEYSDSIFSFALDNLVRVFGIKNNEYFHIVWYDPKHQICPASK